MGSFLKVPCPALKVEATIFGKIFSRST